MSQRRPSDDPSSAPESGTVREAPESQDAAHSKQRQPQSPPKLSHSSQEEPQRKDDPSYAGEER